MDDRTRCNALTTKNTRCRMVKKQNSKYCHMHTKMDDNGKRVINFNKGNVRDNNRDGQHDENRVAGVGPLEKQKKSSRSRKEIKDVDDDIVPIVLVDLNECQCCFQAFPQDAIVMCTGASKKYNHITCTDCLKGFLESVLDEKKSVGCMMSTEGCKGRYRDFDVKNVLSEEQYKKYEDCCSVEETVQIANVLDDYHMCPFCSKYGVIIEHSDKLSNTQLKVDCPRCLKAWCIRCRNESHTPDPCGKLNTTDIEIIRRTIERVIDENAIHKCPKCFTKYNKEDGCNLMTCPTCGIYSCYVCGAQVVPKDGLKYWHFKGSGSATVDATCPLYNTTDTGSSDSVKKGNIEHDNIRVTKALEKLLEINSDDREIFMNLYKEIQNTEYTIKPDLRVPEKKQDIVPVLNNNQINAVNPPMPENRKTDNKNPKQERCSVM